MKKLFPAALILFNCVFVSCSIFDKDLNSSQFEIEKYSAQEWVKINNIKTTYNENPNLQLVFKVKIDSAFKKYSLFPDIKIAKNEILRRASQFSKTNNLDIEDFELQLLIRFINSGVNGKSIFFAKANFNQIKNIEKDTLLLTEIKDVWYEKKDDLDYIDNSSNPPKITLNPNYKITNKEYENAIHSDGYLGSRNPFLIALGFVLKDCDSKRYPQLISNGCVKCGADISQYVNNMGLGRVLEGGEFCK